jgi:D-alanyl-D-alanine carboxypeptidase (penicillin-binding protein 5/6)/beta-lactamase class A
MYRSLLLSLVLAADPAASSLESRLAPLAKAHKGKVAIAVKHLTTGETYTLNADEVMPTASLIKLAVMAEVYQQAKDGKIKLEENVTLRKEDRVQGSGILTDHFSDGATFPLRDAVRLMMAFSDNTATNLVLDKIGIDSTGKRMKEWRFPNTMINAKVFKANTTSIDPERSKKYGLGSTTANEMIGIVEKIQTGKLVSGDACRQMLEHLKKCEDKDKFSRFLPEKAIVAHKTGSVNNARTDAGIIYTSSGPVAVCVLTNENEDQRWKPDNAGNVLCANVGQAVYEHFDTGLKPVAPSLGK